jgi:lysozyme
MRRPRTAVAALGLSAAALVGLVLHEGYSDRAIIPVKGDVPTLGFGSTTRADGSPVRLGDTTTPPQALARALRDVQQFEGALKTCVTVPLAQHEYDAYVSFAYNVGPRAFCQSTLVKKLNTQDYAGAVPRAAALALLPGPRLRAARPMHACAVAWPSAARPNTGSASGRRRERDSVAVPTGWPWRRLASLYDRLRLAQGRELRSSAVGRRHSQHSNRPKPQAQTRQAEGHRPGRHPVRRPHPGRPRKGRHPHPGGTRLCSRSSRCCLHYPPWLCAACTTLPPPVSCPSPPEMLMRPPKDLRSLPSPEPSSQLPDLPRERRATEGPAGWWRRGLFAFVDTNSHDRMSD